MSGQRPISLAATKLQPPLPPAHLFVRSRLNHILDAGVDGQVRLVLVSAPAGSGKSTLLGAWLTERTESVAWLQAEGGDSDPARFWSYLVEAIARSHPLTTHDLTPLIASSKGDEHLVVSAVVNKLAEVSDPLVILIDDYHLIDNARVHRGVERLIDLCPTQVTIVISTRIDPPFRLGRLRVRNQITEIRALDLSFDLDEAAGLLAATAQPLDRELIDQLRGRTEGWAAGLVLAGLSLKGAPDPNKFVTTFRGDDQLVVEYLRDEFLASVEVTDRQRLLETSILDHLSGPLVDAVAGGNGGTTWLRDTASTNQLLIALDRTGTWFRHHHLLRDLLRLEARQTFPERLPQLHANAASWFQSHGDQAQAITHWLASGHRHEAASLLSIVGPRLLAEGQSDTLRVILEQLGDVASKEAWPALLYGWCEFLAGRYSRSDEWLDTMLAVAPAGFDLTLATSPRMNNSLARGDVATALAAARDVIETDQLPSHSCTLATVTGAAFAWAGLAQDARRILPMAVQKAVDEKIHTVHVTALVYQSIVEHESGSADAAHRAACTAIAIAEHFGLTSYHGVAPAYAIRSRTGHDPVVARADVDHALGSARRASTKLGLAYVLTACADTLLELADAAGEPLLLEAHSIIERLVDPGIAGRYLARTESRHHIAPISDPRPAALLDPLTEREMAVLRFLPTALSQRDIAAELYVSLNTVKTHCQAIYRKLGVSDRKAAIQTARDRHVL
ncbi:MAG: LuxR C-terminal-related transcriptional regulator [Mycobacterium sp.]